MALAERMRARITKTGSNVMEDRCFHTIEWAATWEGTRNFLTKKLAATCFLGSSWLPPQGKKSAATFFLGILKKIGSNVLPWNFVTSLFSTIF